MAQRLDLEVGDRLAADVRHRHAEQQRVDVVADDDVLAEVGGLLRVVDVQVQRVVVHREQAEQVVVVLGDRLAGPVLVDRADLELLVVPTELHDPSPSTSWLRPQSCPVGVGRCAECGRCATPAVRVQSRPAARRAEVEQVGALLAPTARAAPRSRAPGTTPARSTSPAAPAGPPPGRPASRSAGSAESASTTPMQAEPGLSGSPRSTLIPARVHDPLDGRRRGEHGEPAPHVRVPVGRVAQVQHRARPAARRRRRTASSAPVIGWRDMPSDT